MPDGRGHPLDINIGRIPDGVGADFAIDLVLGAVTAFPNRPTGIPSLPPGCYELTVTIGSDAGSLIERVRL